MMKRIVIGLMLLAFSVSSCQPADRSTRWSEDIDYFDSQMRGNHKNLFHAIAEPAYKNRIDNLKNRIDSLTDFDLVAGLSQIAATIGDSHTFVHPESFTQQYVPLFIGLFEEGFFIVRAKAGYRGLLGGKVVRIDGHPIDDAFQSIRTTISADMNNEMSYKAIVGSRLTSADLLKSLGMIRDVSKFSVTILSEEGKEVTQSVSAISREAFGKDDWALVIPEKESDRALAYQRNNENYWDTVLTHSSAVYFQYNQCANGQGKSIKKFCDELFEKIQKQHLSRLIIDLRRNSGGDEKLNRPIVEGIKGLLSDDSRIKIFALVGRVTHSAASNLLLDFEKNKLPVTTIGEPTRSKPNFYAENHFFTLPNAKVKCSVSELFRQDSFEGDDRLRIEPAVTVKVTFADYVSGMDAALDAALVFPR